MSTPVFGEIYASAYDDIYSDKDYDRECDVVEELLGRFGSGTLQRLADLGCGTGNHAIRLAGRGFDVSGVDGSSAMLDIARLKAKELGLEIEFEQADLKNLASSRLVGGAKDRPLDAVILMSTIIGYVATNDDLRSCLTAARSTMRDGGVLVADIWYGPAVLASGPVTRFRKIASSAGFHLRLAEGSNDLNRQLYRTQISLWNLEGSAIVSSQTEEHEIRYFFPQELDLLFSGCGFDFKGIFGFPDIEVEPSASSWPVVLAAIAV